MFEMLHQFLLDAFAVERLFHAEDLLQLLVRLSVDLFFTWLAVRVIYVRLYSHNHFVFTYFSFNIVTFALCFLLRKVPIELGFALGLFAVFGILRYRTEAVGIRDLTYLFLVIAIAILNAVANKKVSAAELLTINGTIVGMIYLLEFRPRGTQLEQRRIIYDDLSLLRAGHEASLALALRQRTGMNVVSIHVEQIDLLRDTAVLVVTCAPLAFGGVKESRNRGAAPVQLSPSLRS